MPNTPNQVSTSLDPQSLFKNWVHLTNDQGISCDFENFNFIESEKEEDWTDIDNEPEKIKQQKYLQNYASGEYLAHYLPYQNFDKISVPSSPADKPEIEVIESDGSKARYHYHRLQTNHEGLVGYVLVPTTLPAGKTPDLKILFRGTDPKSWASVSRDLEIGGAGALSFAENRNSILNQINQIIHEFNKTRAGGQNQVSLTVAGHSLGGADAQNCTTALMEGIAQNHGIKTVSLDEIARPSHPSEKRNLVAIDADDIPMESREHLNCVTQLRQYAYNAAGVTETTFHRTLLLDRFLARKHAQHVQGENGVPKIESYNQNVGGDGVQQTGEAHNFCGRIPDPNDAKKCIIELPQHASVDVLKAHIGYEHHHKLSLPATAVLGAVGTLGGASGVALATAAIATSVGLGFRDTAVAHTQHLHKVPRDVQYESFSSRTPEGQVRVKTELGKKSSWLNTLHRGCDSIRSGFQSMKQGASHLLYGYLSHQEGISNVAVAAVPAVTTATATAVTNVEPSVQESPKKKSWFPFF